MASQRITIAKIAGSAGLTSLSKFRKWADLRVCVDPNEWEPSQWPVFARREIGSFASNLRTHGHGLPVVYFNEHVDFWLMGGDYKRWLAPSDGPRAIEVHSDRYQAWCYPLPDSGKFADRLRRSTRLKRIRDRTAQEERWFTAHMLEAILAWTPMVDVAAVVVLREVFGGLIEDLEVEESLKEVPGWLVS